MTIEMSPGNEEQLRSALEKKGETGETFIQSPDPERLVQSVSRKLSPTAEAQIATPNEMPSHFSPEESIRATLEGVEGNFTFEITPKEELPEDFAELEAGEAVKYVAQAAANTEASSNLATDPEDKDHLRRVSENLTGAVGWIANKAGEHKKKIRNTVGAGIFAVTVASCGGDIQAPTTPETGSYPEATVTQVQTEPTVSPEVIEDINQSAQSLVDREFEGVGIKNVSLVGFGFLEDSSGNQYGLFSSEIKSPDGEAAEFMLLGRVSDNNVEDIRGLVLDENDEGPVFEYFGVSYEREKNQFVIEGELLRMNSQTGEIEISVNGNWEELRGPDQTFDSVQASLGQGVLAAPRLNDLTPTPEPTPTPTEIPLPESFADQEAQQEVIDEFLEISGYSSLEEAGEVLKSMPDYGDDQFRIATSDEGAVIRIVYGFVVGSYEISLEGSDFSTTGGRSGDRALIMLVYNPELRAVAPILLGGEISGDWFVGTQAVVPYDKNDPNSFEVNKENAMREYFGSMGGAKRWVEENRGSHVNMYWLYQYNTKEAIGNDERLNSTLNKIIAENGSYVSKYTEDDSSLYEALKKEPETGSTRYILENLSPEQDVGIITYRILQYLGQSVVDS